MTNMPLVPDSPDIFGADDFCTSCQVCTKACPVDAIHPDKQTVRGQTKWYVDFDECIRYFTKTTAAASVSPSARGAAPASRPVLPNA